MDEILLWDEEPQPRSEQEKRLNRFLLKYASDREEKGDHAKADEVRRLVIPRFPHPDT